jgi:hypothetical protein
LDCTKRYSQLPWETTGRKSTLSIASGPSNARQPQLPQWVVFGPQKYCRNPLFLMH